MVFSACKRSPQLPANKMTGVDTVALGMMEVNKKLTQHEDSTLAAYVAGIDSGYVHNEMGFWYKTEIKTGNPRPAVNEKCRIEYSVYALQDNALFKKTVENIVIGKKNTVRGIEEGIKLMHKGEKATLILPWYLAYGMKGDGQNVPGYTSVKVIVRLYP